MPAGGIFAWAKRALKSVAIELYLPFTFHLAKALLGRAGGPRSFAHVGIAGTFSKPANGISRGAVMEAEAMRRAGIDVALLDLTATMRNPAFRLPHRAATSYIYHVGGPQVPGFVLGSLPACRGAYRIAYLAWEFATPPGWPDLTGIVHEIWTPSEFSRAALLKAGYRIPIRVVPHDVPPHPARRTRGAGPFTVLSMADARSSLERKNPAGALEAFAEAFGADPQVRFRLKLNGLTGDLRTLHPQLAEMAAALPNVEILDTHMDADELDRLFESADIFVSLHRGEGFGIPMLESMARGIPVVATGYSGNLQFMDDDVGCLVGYQLVPFANDGVYRSNPAGWADPDVAQAAGFLRRLRGEPAYYEEMSRNAYARACALHDSWADALSADSPGARSGS